MTVSSSSARFVYYTGRVQGVGFRYTAQSIAKRYPIAGWVRNLPDGRVELLIEGVLADVEACLKAIRDYWGEMIRDEAIEIASPTGVSEFEIRV